jgi:hypothetical protein
MGILGTRSGTRVDSGTSSVPQTVATSPGVPGWPGVNTTTSECSCVPPDPSVATAAGYVVEMTNYEEMVWTTSGTFLMNQSLRTFYGVSTSNLAYPKIIYDNMSQRWFATLDDFSSNSVLLAASTSPDPLGAWMAYSVPAYNNEEPLLPFLGASQTMIGISANDYNLTTDVVDGTGYTLVNKTDLQSGLLDYYNSNPQFWLPDGRAMNALSSTSQMWFGGVNESEGSLFWLNWTDAPPATPQYETGGVFVASFSNPPAAPQPLTSDLIGTGAPVANSAVWQDNLETLVFTTGGCSSGFTCIRLDQIWTNNDTLRQDTSIEDVGAALFYPAVSVDGLGDITVVAGDSSSSVYPSSVIFGEAWNEPGSLSDNELLAGSGNAVADVACFSLVCFYGNYFGAATDPSTNLVWTVSEYVTTGVDWSTWIQSAQTTNTTIAAGADPSAVDLGQEATFTSTGVAGSGQLGNYSWTGLPPGCVSADNSTFTCTATTPGTYRVTVTANDSYPTAASSRFTFVVSPAPTVSTPLPSLPGADVGQTREFRVTASLGTAPYAFVWAGLPTGCTGASTDQVTCTFPRAETLSISTTVFDSVNGTASSGPLEYAVSPPLTIGVPVTSSTSVTSGSTFTISATAVGGSGGYVYSWTGLPAGCSSANAATVTCAPTATGSYNVTATVTDSNGANVTSGGRSLEVTAASYSGLLGLPGSAGWVVLALLLAVAAVVIALVLVRRKRSAGPPPPPPPPPPGSVPPSGPPVGGFPPPPPPSPPWVE